MDRAVLAVVRAARPHFRSRLDKLAFAVHAFLLAQDHKLVATGQTAEDEAQDFSSPREEAGIEGWNSLPDAYAFRYQDVAGKLPPLYVKCLVVGDSLLVHWVAPSVGAEPQSASLSVERYTTEAAGAAESYQHLGELVGKLEVLFTPAAAPSGAVGSTAAGENKTAVAALTRGEREEWGEELREPSEGPAGVGVVGYEPPGIHEGVGADDVVPPGFRPPGYGPSGPGLPGLMKGPPRHGGGMYVGPGHPMFGPGRLGGGVGGLPGRGSLPPGARYDPINPEGLPGFHPDDFVPPAPSRPHPDVMQPGPGRGTYFDSMFG